MEEWSFPADYDEAYLPPPGARYWFPERETADPGARERAIVARLRAVMEYAWERAPFYRRKWDEAGVHPGHVTSLEAFERVPVVTKAELRAAQAAHPPFGDYLCVPEREVHHIHGTSGTTGRPTAFGVGRGDWRAIANAHARILWAMGVRPGDRVFVAAIFSLYLGSWGRDGGGRASRLPGVSLRRRRAGHDRARRVVARRDGRRRLLRHPVLRAAPGGNRARRRPRPAQFRTEGHVLLRRAGGVDPRNPRPHRRGLRSPGVRLRDDGRNEPLHERRRRRGRRPRNVALAGHGLSRTLRSWDVRARALGGAGDAGLHPSRTHIATDDPPVLGRPRALDRRAEPVRTDLPEFSGRRLRTHRRHVPGARRKHLPQRNRQGVERPRRLCRRAPHRRQPRKRDGRIAGARRGLRGPRGRRRGGLFRVPAARRRCKRSSACARRSRWWPPAPSRGRTSRRGG